MSPRATHASARAAIEPFDYGQDDDRSAERLVAGSAPGPAQLVRTIPARAVPTPAPAASAPAPAPLMSAVVEREVFARGYAEGERAGIEAAARQLEAQRARLGETLDDLGTLRRQLTHRVEREVVALALTVARRVIHREVTLDRELLLVMARVALDRLGDQAMATIRLHPDDEAALRASRGEWPPSDISVVTDASVKPGGCVVSSDLGLVDLGVDAQIHELSASLLGDVSRP